MNTPWKITAFVLGLGSLIAALTTVAKNSYDFLEVYWKLKGVLGFEQPTVKDRLLSGRLTYVTLGGPACAVPNIGTLVCGATYEVSYRRADNGWIVTGEHERPKNVRTFIYRNANPKKSEMSLWGAPATFDETGSVFLNGVQVGKLNVPQDD